MLLNDADAIYVGGSEADVVYLGSNLVWEKEVAGGPWTPAEIPAAMSGWWDASIASSLTFSGANLVQWNDLSVSAHNLGRAYAGSGPTLTSINGIGALAFVPGQGMATVPTQFDDFTVCAVFKPGNTVAGYERVVEHAYDTGWWIGRTGGTQTWGGGVQDGPPNYGVFVPLADNDTHQISSMRAGASHTVSGNGGTSIQTHAVTTARTGSRRVTVGDDWQNLSPIAGLIAEVLIWSRALPADEIAKTEGYLAHKWGIQAKLPAGHPYKVAPPMTGAAVAPTDRLVTSYTPGAARDDFTGEVGARLNFLSNLEVSWIGVLYSGGVAGNRKVNIYEWFSDVLLRTATIDLTGKAMGEFGWAQIEPITLTAGSYYAVLAETAAGSGAPWSNPGPVTMKPVIGNCYATYRSPGGGMVPTSVGEMYVGVDLGW